MQLPWVPSPAWTERIGALVDSVGRCSGTRVPVLQVVLTDDATLQEHNREYRGEDRPTDVLSFSYLEGHEEHCEPLVRGEVDLDGFLEGPWPEDEEPLAGQVLVSLQTLERVGPVHTGGREAELAFMVVHGMLHVLGHDHADDVQSGVMRAFERELMARIGYPLVTAGTDRPGGVEP